MVRYLKLYNKFLKQYIKTLMEYRADFLLGVVLTFVVSFISILIAYRIWLIGIKRYESSGS